MLTLSMNYSTRYTGIIHVLYQIGLFIKCSIKKQETINKIIKK